MKKAYLTFYIDPSWIRSDWSHIPMLFPFFGRAISKDRSPFVFAAFDGQQFDTSCYSLTSVLDDADMIIFPYRHREALRKDPSFYYDVVDFARKKNKPLLVDGVGDIEVPVTEEHVFVLRYGGYRFSKNRRDIIIPLYVDDLLKRYFGGVIQLRDKAICPSVGFSGWSELTFSQYIRTIIKELPLRLRGIVSRKYNAAIKGVLRRRQAINALKTSDKLSTNILSRPTFSGNKDVMSNDAETLRREFIEVIIGNDYALDVRGDANASMRFFEILSLGRIPIVVDTERNFPFENHIDYSNFILRVDFRDMRSLPDIVRDFHDSLTKEKFVAMQLAARKAFVSYFSTEAMMPHIIKEISEKIADVQNDAKY